MIYNSDINLLLSQKMPLTSRLKQALQIIGMSSQELSEYVRTQAEANPLLETADSEEYVEVEACEDPDYWWEERYDSYDGHDFSKEKLNGRFREDIESRKGMTLKEHLLLQLHMQMIDDDERIIGEYLIDNTDENGYLTISLHEVCQVFGCRIRKLVKILRLLQTFDPPGVCSRNLKECLILQVKQSEKGNTHAMKIIRGYLGELASNKLSLIAKKTGLDMASVMEIYEYIKKLEPKPGRVFNSSENVKYILPDIVIKSAGDHMEIIAEDNIPVPVLRNYYKNIDRELLKGKFEKYVQSRIDNALWFIKCVEQRRYFIKKVAECIIKSQKDFFNLGREHIKPLAVSSISRDTGLHRAIVLRAVKGKYMQCPWGIYELKQFVIPHS